MKIYISLPINTVGFDVDIQRRIANAIKLVLEKNGNIVINPFEVYDKLVKFHKDCKLKEPTRREIMDSDIEELLKCQAIYLCKNWMYSEGCLEEAFIAKKNHILLIFEDENMRKIYTRDSVVKNREAYLLDKVKSLEMENERLKRLQPHWTKIREFNTKKYEMQVRK